MKPILHLSAILQQGGRLLSALGARLATSSRQDAAASSDGGKPRLEEGVASPDGDPGIDPLALGIDPQTWEQFRREGAPADWLARVARQSPGYLRAQARGAGARHANPPVEQARRSGRAISREARQMRVAASDATQPATEATYAVHTAAAKTASAVRNRMHDDAAFARVQDSSKFDSTQSQARAASADATISPTRVRREMSDRQRIVCQGDAHGRDTASDGESHHALTPSDSAMFIPASAPARNSRPAHEMRHDQHVSSSRLDDEVRGAAFESAPNRDSSDADLDSRRLDSTTGPSGGEAFLAQQPESAVSRPAARPASSRIEAESAGGAQHAPRLSRDQTARGSQPAYHGPNRERREPDFVQPFVRFAPSATHGNWPDDAHAAVHSTTSRWPELPRDNAPEAELWRTVRRDESLLGRLDAEQQEIAWNALRF